MQQETPQGRTTVPETQIPSGFKVPYYDKKLEHNLPLLYVTDYCFYGYDKVRKKMLWDTVYSLTEFQDIPIYGVVTVVLPPEKAALVSPDEYQAKRVRNVRIGPMRKLSVEYCDRITGHWVLTDKAWYRLDNNPSEEYLGIYEVIAASCWFSTAIVRCAECRVPAEEAGNLVLAEANHLMKDELPPGTTCDDILDVGLLHMLSEFVEYIMNDVHSSYADYKYVKDLKKEMRDRVSAARHAKAEADKRKVVGNMWPFVESKYYGDNLIWGMVNFELRFCKVEPGAPSRSLLVTPWKAYQLHRELFRERNQSTNSRPPHWQEKDIEGGERRKKMMQLYSDSNVNISSYSLALQDFIRRKRNTPREVTSSGSVRSSTAPLTSSHPPKRKLPVPLVSYTTPLMIKPPPSYAVPVKVCSPVRVTPADVLEFVSKPGLPIPPVDCTMVGPKDAIQLAGVRGYFQYVADQHTRSAMASLVESSLYTSFGDACCDAMGVPWDQQMLYELPENRVTALAGAVGRSLRASRHMSLTGQEPGSDAYESELARQIALGASSAIKLHHSVTRHERARGPMHAEAVMSEDGRCRYMDCDTRYLDPPSNKQRTIPCCVVDPRSANGPAYSPHVSGVESLGRAGLQVSAVIESYVNTDNCLPDVVS